MCKTRFHYNTSAQKEHYANPRKKIAKLARQSSPDTDLAFILSSFTKYLHRF